MTAIADHRRHLELCPFCSHGGLEVFHSPEACPERTSVREIPTALGAGSYTLCPVCSGPAQLVYHLGPYCNRLGGHLPMNYDQARELKDNESGESRGWHWTTMRDGKVRPAWPCIRAVGEVTEAKPADPEAPADVTGAAIMMGGTAYLTCDPHATREEAERHFYDACLEAVEEQTFLDWSGCKVCDNPTKKGLGNKLLARAFSHPTPLCDAHRNREELGKLVPFEPGLSSIHS